MEDLLRDIPDKQIAIAGVFIDSNAGAVGRETGIW
jgi:hypothetical protein